MNSNDITPLIGTTQAFPLHLVDIDASANPRPLKQWHVKELAEDFVSRFDKGQTVQLQEVVVIPHPDPDSHKPLKLALGFHRGHGFALANLMLGERGLAELPVRAHVVTADDAAQLITDNFTENATHMGIDPIAQLGYIKALKALGKTNVEVAARLKVSAPQITQRLKLDLLPDAIKAKVATGEIPVTAALAMVTMDEGQQQKAAKALDEINAAVADPTRVGGIKVPRAAIANAAAGVVPAAGGDGDTSHTDASASNGASNLRKGIAALLRVVKVSPRLNLLPAGVAGILDLVANAVEGVSADQPGFLRELAQLAVKTEGTVPKASPLGKELAAAFEAMDAEEAAEANAERDAKVAAQAEAKALKDKERADAKAAKEEEARKAKEAKAEAEREAKAQAKADAQAKVEADKAAKAQVAADAKAKAAADKAEKARLATEAKEAEKAAAAKLKADKAAQAALIAQQMAKKAQADAVRAVAATKTPKGLPLSVTPGTGSTLPLSPGTINVPVKGTKQPRGLSARPMA